MYNRWQDTFFRMVREKKTCDQLKTGGETKQKYNDQWDLTKMQWVLRPNKTNNEGWDQIQKNWRWELKKKKVLYGETKKQNNDGW